jgi:uncharacterized paraquat-inducible protein A
LFNQYVSIGVATAFAAFGMASLLRKAILQQIDARLLADNWPPSRSASPTPTC